MLLSEHEMTKESGVKLTLVVPEEYDCGIGHTCDSRTHNISGHTRDSRKFRAQLKR